MLRTGIGRLGRAIALGFAAALSLPAAAQDYPNRPIHVMVGFPPGGINDVVARIIAEQLGPRLGQRVVVENRPGASGTIAADLVAKAAPDGYTILLGSVSSIAMAPGQYPNLPYNPAKDFAPIALAAASPNVLVVHKDFKIDSVRDLIEQARQRPGTINFSSAGEGSSNHLTVELLMAQTKIKLVHVPYRGDSPATQDVIAGHIPMTFSALPVAIPFIKGGLVRPIAVSSEKRSPQLPDVPTVAESGGLPTFAVSVWVGFFAPPGTPGAVVSKLDESIAEALRLPAVQEKLRQIGVEPDHRGPADFAAYIESEVAKWTGVSKRAD